MGDHDEEIRSLLRGIDFKIDDDVKQHATIDSRLDDILNRIASDGELPFQWKDLKALVELKTCLLLDEYFRTYGFTGPLTESFDSRRAEILHLMHSYQEAPFTVQRLCELIQKSSGQYRSTYALMNALVRVLSVTSTVPHGAT